MVQPVNKKLLKDFGARIRGLRTALGLSQEQLAELTGFHRTYIGMIERGERNLSLSNVEVFAKSFRISIRELVDFKNGRGES
jgi:transcriptional regulator with XRE-family HTH domain